MAGVPQTYAQLQASVLAWLDDATIADRVPEMIGLAEARLSRALNVPQMEVVATFSVVNGTVTLPDELMAIRNVYLNETRRTTLQVVSQEDFQTDFDTSLTGMPAVYAIIGGQIFVSPYPDKDYTIKISYKRSLPALSDASPTNWLLRQAPDLYLFYSILMAEAYGVNDPRLGLLSTIVDNMIVEVNAQGVKLRHGAGPLVMRPRNSETNFGYRRGDAYDAPVQDNDGNILVDG